VLISDTSVIANDTPSLTVGLRGLCYMEVEVVGQVVGVANRWEVAGRPRPRN